MSSVTNKKTALVYLYEVLLLLKVTFSFSLPALCVHTHETRILSHDKDNHIKGEYDQTWLNDLSSCYIPQ